MDKAAITAAGFAPVRRSPKRLIASIQGAIKTGKTRLALSAPKPIGYISIEIGGDEGVTDQYIPEGQNVTEDIQIVKIKMAPPAYPNRGDYGNHKDDQRKYDDAVGDAIMAVAGEALDKFYGAYYASLENFTTTVIDTGGHLWELVRLSNFGRLEKIPQLAYGQVNKQFEDLIAEAYSYSGNLILTHHLKEKYDNVMNDRGKLESTPTGIFIPQGYKDINKQVQAVIETYRENLTEPDEVTLLNVKFGAEIVDSRHNAASMGKTFDYDDLTFANIGKTIVGGTEKDWK